MSTPYHIILSDSEDEPQEPTTTIILSDSEDESPLNSPLYGYDGEYYGETEEEDPMEEDPMEEAEMEEPPPTTDPYFPQSYQPTDAHQWADISAAFQHWGTAEGHPFPGNGASSSTAPPHPTTGEPSPYSIPLLVARLNQQEDRIEQLENNVEALTGPTHVEELQQEVWTLEHHFQHLEEYTKQLACRIAQDPSRSKETERRLDGIEGSLEKLHTMAGTMGGYADYILNGHHKPK